MASKKIFTSLEFQSGAKLVAPKVELRTPAATLTDPTDGSYYTGSAGQLAYGADTNLYVHNGTGWKALHHAGQGFSTDQVITSTIAGALGSGSAPFIVTSTKQVDNLKAELLGTSTDTLAAGTHRISTEATEHGIPVYGVGGVLKVGTPVADDDAAPKVYVDNAVQGLDHKESVVVATTANITIATALNNADTLDGVTLQDGDRVLVKDQSTSSENGIYIVGATPVLANDSNLGSELIENGTFTGPSGAPSGWTAPGGATLTLDADRMKVLGGYALDSFTTVVGKTYRLQFDLTVNNPGGFYLGSSTNSYDIISSGALSSNLTAATYYFVAKSTTTYLSLYAWNGGTQYAFYDNVSVKEDNLTEGAYVFVEKGTANENSSWVLSTKVTETSATGNGWTQFSGAGQLTVNSNGAVAAPLTKSGDTIDFRYSLDNALSTTSAVDLTTNGAFDSDTGWTKGTGWTITGGNAVAAAAGDGSQIYQVVTGLTVGKRYRLSFTVSGFTDGSVDAYFAEAGETGATTPALTGTGTATIEDVATGTTQYVSIVSRTAASDFTVSEITLVEVNALTVKSGGIDTVHLANDAVEPAKLLETGAFTMGGLTVNGATT
jgi:hypothetical protein